MMSDTVISLKKLVKTYKQGDTPVYALKSIDLEVKRGEFISVMGPSGCGKSTLMNIIGLLDHQNAGSYLLNDIEVGSMSDNERSLLRSKSIGFIFQSFNLLTKATALRNVILPLTYQRVPVHERMERASKALESVGLAHRLHHYPNQMSGGECQRVAIARALVGGPSVLLADEPTGNLDSKIGSEIMMILEKLAADGMTVMMVTHDAVVARRANKIINMLDGKINNAEFIR